MEADSNSGATEGGNKISIYIKDMNLPKEKTVCLLVSPDGQAFVKSESGQEEKYQLMPVPEHGRLIDADAAIANRNADMNWCYDLCDLPDYLADCPTVIPAD